MSKLLRLAALTAVLCGMLPAAAGDIPLGDRKSGYALMGREIQAMQDDDSANPGMLSVFDGEALWSRKAGAAEKSCADCHGDARASMRGVAARYPAYHAARARPIDLEQRINTCRVEQQTATPLQHESKELLALTAYVGLQSRGMPLQPTDERLRPFIEAGRETFNRRQGQINLSCAQCHDERWGQRLAGSVIPQGHATGYPLYRLEWQALGSLQRRLRNCLTGMRAELYPLGASEYVDLQLYLMWRARGLPVETPAVRP
jgi:L-cysteine S-thiosulfotransferase